MDIGHDYYLITLICKEDHQTGLLEGPWLIYDHYFRVSEWRPNFNHLSDTIEQFVVWFHISGLPIEYYDNHLVSCIGNSVGKTVNVDKTTFSRERGKYARLLILVDLTEPLLVVFEIKGRCIRSIYLMIDTINILAYPICSCFFFLEFDYVEVYKEQLHHD